MKLFVSQNNIFWNSFYTASVVVLIISFISSSLYIPQAHADELNLPKPGVMVHLSPEYTPAYLKGIVIHPENALKFDFIIYKGETELTDAQKRVEYTKLTKYFLASLAIPDDDQWVNLSPYEKDRIIKDDFGKTEMGRDLLAQDYILKQITASLIYPEDSLGKKFWDKVYSQVREQYGTTDVPVNTFNKVWILPDDALIYEKGNTAYVLKNHLRVMLEEDYLSLQKHSGIESAPVNKTQSIASKIVKEIVLPELEREVNEDKNFATVRQVYSGMLLATWYKRALKESLLSMIYANKAKVKGVDSDPKTNEEIYRRYLRAYKKGVFNYIREDVDKYTNEIVPRKYFSGGAVDYAEAARELGRVNPYNTTNSLNHDQAQVVQAGLNDTDYASFVVEESKIAKEILPMTGNGNNFEPPNNGPPVASSGDFEDRNRGEKPATPATASQGLLQAYNQIDDQRRNATDLQNEIKSALLVDPNDAAMVAAMGVSIQHLNRDTFLSIIAMQQQKAELGWKMTEDQADALAKIMTGAHFIVEKATGGGKTAMELEASLIRHLLNPQAHSLIVVPTEGNLDGYNEEIEKLKITQYGLKILIKSGDNAHTFDNNGQRVDLQKDQFRDQDFHLVIMDSRTAYQHAIDTPKFFDLFSREGDVAIIDDYHFMTSSSGLLKGIAASYDALSSNGKLVAQRLESILRDVVSTVAEERMGDIVARRNFEVKSEAENQQVRGEHLYLNKTIEDKVVNLMKSRYENAWDDSIEQTVREAAQAAFRGMIGVETADFYQQLVRTKADGTKEIGYVENYRENSNGEKEVKVKWESATAQEKLEESQWRSLEELKAQGYKVDFVLAEKGNTNRDHVYKSPVEAAVRSIQMGAEARTAIDHLIRPEQNNYADFFTLVDKIGSRNIVFFSATPDVASARELGFRVDREGNGEDGLLVGKRQHEANVQYVVGNRTQLIQDIAKKVVDNLSNRTSTVWQGQEVDHLVEAIQTFSGREVQELTAIIRQMVEDLGLEGKIRVMGISGADGKPEQMEAAKKHIQDQLNLPVEQRQALVLIVPRFEDGLNTFGMDKSKPFTIGLNTLGESDYTADVQFAGRSGNLGNPEAARGLLAEGKIYKFIDPTDLSAHQHEIYSQLRTQGASDQQMQEFFKQVSVEQSNVRFAQAAERAKARQNGESLGGEKVELYGQGQMSATEMAQAEKAFLNKYGRLAQNNWSSNRSTEAVREANQNKGSPEFVSEVPPSIREVIPANVLPNAPIVRLVNTTYGLWGNAVSQDQAQIILNPVNGYVEINKVTGGLSGQLTARGELLLNALHQAQENNRNVSLQDIYDQVSGQVQERLDKGFNVSGIRDDNGNYIWTSRRGDELLTYNDKPITLQVNQEGQEPIQVTANIYQAYAMGSNEQEHTPTFTVVPASNIQLDNGFVVTANQPVKLAQQYILGENKEPVGYLNHTQNNGEDVWRVIPVSNQQMTVPLNQGAHSLLNMEAIFNVGSDIKEPPQEIAYKIEATVDAVRTLNEMGLNRFVPANPYENKFITIPVGDFIKASKLDDYLYSQLGHGMAQNIRIREALLENKAREINSGTELGADDLGQKFAVGQRALEYAVKWAEEHKDLVVSVPVPNASGGVTTHQFKISDLANILDQMNSNDPQHAHLKLVYDTLNLAEQKEQINKYFFEPLIRFMDGNGFAENIDPEIKRHIEMTARELSQRGVSARSFAARYQFNQKDSGLGGHQGTGGVDENGNSRNLNVVYINAMAANIDPYLKDAELPGSKQDAQDTERRIAETIIHEAISHVQSASHYQQVEVRRIIEKTIEAVDKMKKDRAQTVQIPLSNGFGYETYVAVKNDSGMIVGAMPIKMVNTSKEKIRLRYLEGGDKRVYLEPGQTLNYVSKAKRNGPFGGIDFNAANLNLQIKRDGKGVPLPISQQILENIHIDGLIPICIEIKPAIASPLVSQLQISGT